MSSVSPAISTSFIIDRSPLISIQKKNNSRNNQGHHTATKKTDIPEGVSSEGKKISSMFQEWSQTELMAAFNHQVLLP